MNAAKKIEGMAERLESLARSPEDNEAAQMLRKLLRVYEVSYEMVWAKTHSHSVAAYAELIDLIKGKYTE